MLTFNNEYIDKKLKTSSIIKKYQKNVNQIYKNVINEVAVGSDMTGWLHIDQIIKTQDIIKINKTVADWKALRIKDVVVIGIGGSYIGIKAAIDMINCKNSNGIKFHWIYNMSANYMLSVLEGLEKKKFGIVIISKSGTTLEPAIGFRLFRELLIQNVGIKNSKKYIVAITDANKGTLHNYAKIKEYTMFAIPDNIGGRFSTLTAVGLFVMALAGIELNKVLRGAKQALIDLNTASLRNNSAFLYACYRYHLYTQLHLQVENVIVYEPSLEMIGHQWQQLFAESEGKKHKALYPITSVFTGDLHSVGQYLQDGTRNFFETTIMIDNPCKDKKLRISNNDDGLKYLNGKSLDELTKKAFMGTVKAHYEKGKVNNFIINLTKADEYHYGYLFMWIAHAAMMSAYLLKVNPFDQPGVEAYKANMFDLLKRPK